MQNDKVKEVLKWAERLEPIFSRKALANEESDAGPKPMERVAFRTALLRSLGIYGEDVGWAQKGIYVWYWRAEKGSDAWPLYVGKSQRGRSTFASRTDAHIRHASGGVDFIYSPDESRKRSMLFPVYEPKKMPVRDGHLSLVQQQFSDMSILLLPMTKGEAEEIANVAEGMFLEAMLQIHEGAGRGRGDNYDQVMNSKGRAFNAAHLGTQVEPIKNLLLASMV